MPGVAGGKAFGAAVPLIVAAVLLFGFYLWTASAALPLGFGEAQDRPYNLLTQALLRGQLEHRQHDAIIHPRVKRPLLSKLEIHPQ